MPYHRGVEEKRQIYWHVPSLCTRITARAQALEVHVLQITTIRLHHVLVKTSFAASSTGLLIRAIIPDSDSRSPGRVRIARRPHSCHLENRPSETDGRGEIDRLPVTSQSLFGTFCRARLCLTVASNLGPAQGLVPRALAASGSNTHHCFRARHGAPLPHSLGSPTTRCRPSDRARFARCRIPPAIAYRAGRSRNCVYRRRSGSGVRRSGRSRNCRRRIGSSLLRRGSNWKEQNSASCSTNEHHAVRYRHRCAKGRKGHAQSSRIDAAPDFRPCPAIVTVLVQETSAARAIARCAHQQVRPRERYSRPKKRSARGVSFNHRPPGLRHRRRLLPHIHSASVGGFGRRSCGLVCTILRNRPPHVEIAATPTPSTSARLVVFQPRAVVVSCVAPECACSAHMVLTSDHVLVGYGQTRCSAAPSLVSTLSRRYLGRSCTRSCHWASPPPKSRR
jgi:hypothetical protein